MRLWGWPETPHRWAGLHACCSALGHASSNSAPWESPLHSLTEPSQPNPSRSLSDQAEIRKAYLKLAVTLHPDKNNNDLQATQRFQTLQELYGILSDPDK